MGRGLKLRKGVRADEGKWGMGVDVSLEEKRGGLMFMGKGNGVKVGLKRSRKIPARPPLGSDLLRDLH